MKNRLVNVLLFVFLIILGILIFFSIKDYNNRPGNNIKINKNVNTNNSINNDSSNDIKNNNEKEESGPAETEEEENKNEKEENVTVILELIGEEEVVIKQGDKYIDAGIRATDSNGNDVTDKITVDNKVNTNKKGEYMVIYSYGKSIVVRKVIVE